MATDAADRYAKRKELFLAVTEQPADEREAFLAAACAGDAELAREVRAMLDSETTLAEPLPAMAAAAGSTATRSGDVPTEIRGERGYRRLREIGRGGMGVVYLAERTDADFRQRVALKVLRGGRLEGAGALQRFRAERQILARLEHPHIARLLDGGQDEDGSPFLVMEYVEGEPIDRHCAVRGLDVEERLRLFRQVCLAVQAAHQRLVVHRDLKPSNILVTADGEPKLLDFGIAKLLDPTADWTMAETRLGEQPLTPRYASPEQVLGEPVTTATDIYSLGVVLYELLTGCSPYDVDLPLPRLARAICEDEPPAPSTAVTRDREPTTAPAAAEERVRRGRRLRGDLDAIVLKALRKDPAARYASAEALAADIDRHLAGLPVLARAGGLRYRAGKFVRRHWLGLGVAAAFVTLVLAFSFDRQAQLLATAAERDKAKAAVEFLVDLFELADPNEARGNSITVREALDRGAERVDRELAGQPETQATLLEAIGRVYQNLGLHRPAIATFDRAVALRRAGDAGGPIELATSLQYLAGSTQAAGELAAAEALLREALALVPAEAEPTTHAQLLAALARHYLDQGRFVEARTLQADAYHRLSTAPSVSELDLAESATALLMAILATSDGTDPRPQIALAAGHLERAGDRDPLRQAMVRGELGVAWWGVGELELAAAELDRAIGGIEPVVPADHPELANLLNNRGLVRLIAGDNAGAATDLERSRAMWTALVGENHPRTALATANLGVVALRRGDWQRARELIQKGFALGRATLPADHPDLGKDLVSLADIELELGTFDAARALLEEARPIIEHEAAPLTVADYHRRWSRYHLHAGDPAAAERLARQALAQAESALGADAPKLAGYTVALARSLLAQDRLAEARSQLEPLVARRIKKPPGPGDAALPEALLGRVLLDAGASELDRAVRLLETARVTQARLTLASHSTRVETTLWLALALFRQGQHDRARTLLDEAIAAVEAAFPTGHPLLVTLRQTRADLPGVPSTPLHPASE